MIVEGIKKYFLALWKNIPINGGINLNFILLLIIIIIFELISDILAKEYSLNGKINWFVYALLFYIITNSIWLYTLRINSELVKGAVFFSMGTLIGITLIGICMYNEQITYLKITGILLALLSMYLINL